MPMARIVPIEIPQGLPPTIDHPREDRRVHGCPERRTWALHEAGPMGAGVWACEVGRWRIAFPANKQEYFFVLEGHVRLHGPKGECTEVKAGQAAVIPPGFEGEFEVVQPVRKHYVVVQA